jgi:outer membrane protein assembly factor BamB
MTRITILGATLAVAAAARAAPPDQQWPQFRGPAGSGAALNAVDLPVKFGPESNVAWKCEVPAGHSSPCVWGDRVFLTGATDRDVRTLCVDRKTGAVLWEQTALTDTFESRHGVNSPATPTPTTDGERVFVYFGSCGLICYDFEGNEVWMRRVRIPENMYGTAASPIVAGRFLVFLNDNARASSLEAIDPATGSTVWKKERTGFSAGWSTPMHWRNGDVDEVVTYGVGWLTAYALEDGAERWSVPGLTDEPCITPVSSNGIVYVTSYNMRTNPEVIGLPAWAKLVEEYDGDGDGRLSYAEIRPNRSILSRNDADGEGDHPLPGFYRFLDEDRDGQLTEAEWQKMIAFLDQFTFANGLLAIRPGDGERETEVVWTSKRGVPECPSPLCYDGRIYMVKNGGLATCVDATTGDRRYFERVDAGGPYYASPVAGDGKVYLTSARGMVTVLAAGDELKILARNDLGERCMATPAIVGRTLLIRTESTLYAFESASTDH